MGRGVERGFVLLAVAMLAFSGLAAVATPSGASADRHLDFDSPVPDEYAFEVPTAPGRATVVPAEEGTTDDGSAESTADDDRAFDSVQAAVDAASPGDTVRLSGRFDERVTVNTPGLVLESEPGTLAVIDGGGEGDVLTLNADAITVRRVWIRNSGFETSGNDAAVWVNSTGAVIEDSRVSAMTFGIWVDGVTDVVVRNNTIVGRERVLPHSYRGNGIELWKADRALVVDNRITDVRDGIYYSWASGVVARNNTMWDLRYGVHYMYSDDCRLEGNLAFDNDVGFALMVSRGLTIVNNTAINNVGTSGHGILVKSIDDSVIAGNHLVANRKGLYVYNSQRNVVAHNLLLANDVGLHLTAGSFEADVFGNSFVHNRQPVVAVTSQTQVTWNASGHGNYWSTARTIDTDKDGVSEIRYRPTGLVEYLAYEHPHVVVFAHSPAFDAIRMAESSFPVIESPGVVDAYPLTRSPHDNWRDYYEDR